jgi:hypothetical protein
MEDLAGRPEQASGGRLTEPDRPVILLVLQPTDTAAIAGSRRWFRGMVNHRVGQSASAVLGRFPLMRDAQPPPWMTAAT